MSEAAHIEKRHVAPELAHRIDLSLRACHTEGILSQFVTELFNYFIVPFALFLKASPYEIGVLVAVPNLLAAVLQPLVVTAYKLCGGRKHVILMGFAIQAVILPALALVSFSTHPHRLWHVLILVSAFRVVGSLVGPCWGSLVSEYLPGQRRGRYFGQRSRATGIAGLIGMALWGVILGVWGNAFGAYAFAALFLFAAVFRLASIAYMARMVEIPHEPRRENDFTFWMFIRRIRESNFLKFILYVSAIALATQVSAAYISVRILDELRLGYFVLVAVQMGAVGSSLLTFPLWGRHADEVGNAKIIRATGLALPFIPLLWFLCHGPVEFLVVEVFAGFVWCGFNLAATNFIYDAVSPGKRIRCLAYFNLINGIAVALGSYLGGVLAETLPAVGGSAIATLFLVSAGMRLFCNLFLLEKFKEVRPHTKRARSAQVYASVLGLRPMLADNEVEVEPYLLGRFIPRRPRSAA